ncbi:MAG: type II secretion system F family protein [Spirochaetales bacterium]|nr:type II secretion system F family protein [Spirochaetales bacterium]
MSRKSKDVLELTRSLSLLTSSGLTIQDSIKLTKKIQSRSKIMVLMERIEMKLAGGLSFSKAIGEEDLFSPLYKGLVEIGERGGNLNLVFSQLVSYLEGNNKVSEKIKSAMIYPLLLLVLIILGVGGLILFFIPNLQNSLSFDPDVAMELEMAIGRARFILALFVCFAALCMLFILFYKILGKKGNGLSLAISRLLLNIPLLKGFILKNEMLNLFFALQLMTECRIPLEESLQLCQLVMNNLYLKGQLFLIKQELVKGELLSLLFEKQRIFPPEISGWIALGEKVGNVESVFGRLKELYQADVDNMSERIINLVEPVSSLIIGIVLIVIVIVLIVPLMTVYGGLI